MISFDHFVILYQIFLEFFVRQHVNSNYQWFFWKILHRPSCEVVKVSTGHLVRWEVQIAGLQCKIGWHRLPEVSPHWHAVGRKITQPLRHFPVESYGLKNAILVVVVIKGVKSLNYDAVSMLNLKQDCMQFCENSTIHQNSCRILYFKLSYLH